MGTPRANNIRKSLWKQSFSTSVYHVRLSVRRVSSLIWGATHRSKSNLCIFILDLFRVLAFSYSWVEDINNYLIFYFIRSVDFRFKDIVINKAIQNYMKRIVVLYVEKLHSKSFLAINVSSIVPYLYQLEIFY